MRVKLGILVGSLGAALLLAAGLLLRPPAGVAEADSAALAERPPRIFPDYRGVVLPPNLAPMNFRIEEPGAQFRVRIHSDDGKPLALSSRTGKVTIPPGPWRQLLRANPGRPLYLEVQARETAGHWTRFETITNRIAREEIDGYLAYRLLRPLYNYYVDVGIYQRNLQDFAQVEVLQNQSFGRGCLNCHTFLNRGTEQFALHIRSGRYGNAMLLVRSNRVAKVAKTAGYLAWHPGGRLLAFSANKLSLFFHTKGETRDVFDAESNLSLYDLDANRIVTPPAIAQPEWLETWPTWSPDGRYLYFCRARKLPQENYRQVCYDLVRVNYDPATDRWGEPETLVASRETGLSAAQPRLSPDGRWVVFCLSAYGSFPIYQASSDLYVLEVRTGHYRRLNINSDQSESWHSWSSNSRWLVFSSKRLDGLFARPFLSYVDEQGTFHKPLLLPQQDPDFYDSFLKTFNVPELVRDPVRISPAELAAAVAAPRTLLTPRETTASPPPATPSRPEPDSTYLELPRGDR